MSKTRRSTLSVSRLQSAVTLYLRLHAAATTIGVQGENVWINADLAHDDLDGQTRGVLEGRPRRIYVSFPSIKAGDTRFHTAEIIAFVDAEAFGAWRTQPKGTRGAGYSALKARTVEGLLELTESAITVLRGLVRHAELSAPLNVEHYTSHAGGAIYGLPATPERYRATVLGPCTPSDGLVLTGADAGCLGIVGSLMGGVGETCQVLGSRGFPTIQRAVRKGPARPAGTAPIPPLRERARLAAKQQLTPTIWGLDLDLERPLESFTPGQYARLHVGNGQWRDYSIAGLCEQRLRLLVSTRTGGHGSSYVEGVAAGAVTEIEAPMGHYTLAGSGRRQVFVATGTGLAPFLPMFAELESSSRLDDATLLFGCRTAGDDLTATQGPLPGRVLRCVSGEGPPAGAIRGRVTQALADLEFDPAETDVYVCGSSAMVADCQALLEARGARHVHVEVY